jgi:hypothetical protein
MFKNLSLSRKFRAVIAPLIDPRLRRLEKDVSISKVLHGQILTNLLPKDIDELQKAEFRVYSQYGEDGIIQYLLSRLSLSKELQVCVEIGCEDYSEANTRFLLESKNWQAFVFDGSKENIEAIRQLDISWRCNLQSHAEFITRDNINRVLLENAVPGEVGLLSLDIDGNDYWVWEKLEVVSPILMIVEYNGLLGSSKPVVVPYQEKFNRFDVHYSGLYWGASIKALEFLAKKKGYSLIGSNSAGCNAFFVRNDWAKYFDIVSAEKAYRKTVSRDARDRTGQFSFLSFSKQQQLIAGLDAVNVESGVIVKL